MPPSRQQPPRFAGGVTQGGVSVPDGIRVSAWIEDEEVASIATSDGTYLLRIDQPQGENFQNKEITFHVNGVIANEKAVWKPGRVIELKLTVPEAATPTPWPTLTPTARPTATPTPTSIPWEAYPNSNEKWGYTITAPRGWTVKRSSNEMEIRSPDDEVVVKIFAEGYPEELSPSRFAEERVASVIKKYSTSYEFFDLSATENRPRGGQFRVLFPWRWQRDKDSCVMDMEDMIFRSRHFPKRPYGYIVRIGICDERLISFLKVRQQIFDSFAESELPKKPR